MLELWEKLRLLFFLSFCVFLAAALSSQVSIFISRHFSPLLFALRVDLFSPSRNNSFLSATGIVLTGLLVAFRLSIDGLSATCCKQVCHPALPQNF